MDRQPTHFNAPDGMMGHAMDDEDQAGGETGTSRAGPERRFEDLPPAAQRALREAKARRKAREAQSRPQEREVGGRGGADPARFGDWEIKGRAIDF